MTLFWHYTSLDGFLGIIKSDRLWASNVLFMNDDAELRHGLKVIYDVLTNCMRDTADLAWAAELELIRRRINVIPNNVYSVSFCGKHDLLSQWRGYAGGAGVSMGFAFDEKMLSHVIYRRDEQEQLVIDALEKPHGRGALYPYAICEQLNTLMVRFKHNSFDQEEEYRMVVLHKKTEGSEKTDEPQIGLHAEELHPIIRERIRLHREHEVKVEFRTQNGLIVPYVNAPVYAQDRTDYKLPLQKIYIGPAANKPLLKKAIRLALDQYGYPDVQIGQTSTPYRG